MPVAGAKRRIRGSLNGVLNRLRASDRARRSLEPVAQVTMTMPGRVGELGRMCFEATLPEDPLLEEPAGPISLVVPCHPKDFPLLTAVVDGASQGSRNSISSVTIVVPDGQRDRVQGLPGGPLILEDSEVIPPDLLVALADFVPLTRRGWAKQQLIKFLCAVRSQERATLVLDSDTVLLRPRTWWTPSGLQALCVSHEYHAEYGRHIKRSLGVERARPFSFVTHHQLMQKDVVEGMFGSDAVGLEQWLVGADWSSLSAISEYETYGTWLVRNAPERAVLAQWNNRTVSRASATKMMLHDVFTPSILALRHQGASSISSHQY